MKTPLTIAVDYPRGLFHDGHHVGSSTESYLSVLDNNAPSLIDPHLGSGDVGSGSP